jgi:hypothetical protein
VTGRVVLTVAAGLVLVACGSPYAGSTVAQQVQSWIKTTGFVASLDALRGDASRIAVIEARHDAGAQHTDCDVLVDDVLGANQNLPTPDDQLTRILSSAYSAASDAGRRCASGAAGSGWSQVQEDLSRAGSGYIKAQARLDALNVTVAGLGP